MAKKRKIDWLNHFLEFIVVIIGILIAFQLNSWAEGNREEDLVDEHISYIVEETEFNINNLGETIAYTENFLGTLDTLINSIVKEGAIEKINSNTLEMMKLNNNYIKKNAYNALIESGDIRFVSDYNLKNDIIALYENYRWSEGMDEMTRTTYIQFFYPYMIENLDLMMATPQDRIIYENKKFKNILSVYKYTLKARLEVHKQTLQEMKDFLETYKK